MRKAGIPALAAAAVMGACLALAGCPLQSTYPPTITPIYAAASGALWVYNGAGWTSSPFANASAVVVVGSGSGAVAYVGTSTGAVSQFVGASKTATTGFVGVTGISRLFSGSSIYAATNAGVSILNSDGLTWSNTGTAAPVNDVFSIGTVTLVASGTSLYQYNNGGPAGSIPATTIIGSSTNVTAVYVDSLGDIIVGTNKGVAIQYGGTGLWTSLLPLTATVNQITMDQNGNLYTATSSGLYVNATVVLAGSVSCVWVDGAGTIYAGTATGLRVSKDGGSTWTTQLPGQAVTSVVTTAPLYSF